MSSVIETKLIPRFLRSDIIWSVSIVLRASLDREKVMMVSPFWALESISLSAGRLDFFFPDIPASLNSSGCGRPLEVQ